MRTAARVVARVNAWQLTRSRVVLKVRPAPALTYFIGGSGATMRDSRARYGLWTGPGWREMVRGEGGKAAETPERWLSSS